MATSRITRATGLVCLGFLGGLVFSQLAPLSQGSMGGTHERALGTDQTTASSNLYDRHEQYSILFSTPSWDVLSAHEDDGRHIALGQNGLLRVVIIDDVTSLHVMTYADQGPAWQGRLMDVGNDGTVEVADITGGRCENFPK